MRRISTALFLMCVVALTLSTALAQDNPRLQQGDPPRASLITVSEANDAGVVTIAGAQNSIFPAAQLAIRNLYTHETVYTQAGITGSFSTQLYGPGSTPFLISPAPSIPQNLRDRPGSLPGGPAVIVYGSQPATRRDGVDFTVDGLLGGGPDLWTARGNVNRVVIERDDPNPIVLRLAVEMPLPDSGPDISTLRFIGTLDLLPVAVHSDGSTRAVGSLTSNNGWSGVLTTSGLAIDDIGAPYRLADVAVGADEIAPVLNGLAFTLTFERHLPSDLPDGLYVPLLRGFVRSGDSAPEAWEVSSLFGRGAGVAPIEGVRLPLVLNVGGLADVRLPFALLIDNPSDGGRGILALEDQAQYALSNRVRLNSPTYILPPQVAGNPAAYSLEPHLLMQLPNTYDRTVPPLLPFALPGGTLIVRVQAPDGSVPLNANYRFAQAVLSTAALDERVLFGTRSLLDTYQLTTLDNALRAFNFDQYGEYTITLRGEVDDVFGNRYTGGGDYRLLIAEPCDLTPAVLPGTPFEAGDIFSAGLHIAPGVPADVTVTMRVFPLAGGDPLETVLSGRANANGYFVPEGDPLVLDVAGEYIVDYEARYTDIDGRLWAGSLRGAGMIAGDTSDYVARGARGLQGITTVRPPWYIASRLQEAAGVEDESAVVYAPFHSGDVAWVADGAENGLAPRLHLQDIVGTYRDWLIMGRATDASHIGATLREAAAIEELPAALFGSGAQDYNPAATEPPVNIGYTYVSVVTPGVTLRQFVSAAVTPTLTSWVDMDDPLNGQIGAGFQGLLPGDFMFIFGGALLRNSEIDTRAAVIYGSYASVIEPDDVRGVRVSPPARGADGGVDGGPLLTIDEVSYDAFVLPTGVLPGDVLTLGDTFVFSGQVAPALPALVQVRVIAPSGALREYSVRASAIGHVYDPTQDFAVDESGVWQVEVRVTHDSMTSTGQIQPPFPTGGLLGAPDGRYAFYVTSDAGARLAQDTRTDQIIPSALPYNFNFALPNTWTDATVYYTLTVPGYVVEQGTLRLSGRSFSYQLNPSAINRRFPNVEVEGRIDGAAASDARRITFFVVAQDDTGALVNQYRQFSVFHDRLISLEG